MLNKYPGDWQLVPLGEITERFIGGGTPSTSAPEYWEGSVPWITGADAEQRIATTARKSVTEKGVKESSTSIVPEGNILLVTRTGVGKVSIAGVDIAISQDLTGVVPKQDIVDVSYLYRQLKHLGTELKRLSQGTIIQGIKREEVKDLPIPLPPLPEQRRIAEILDTADAAIRETERVIAKLREIKQGLLHDLLTRGLDVHGHLRDLDQAAKIPSVPFSEIAEINPPVNVGKLAPETQVSFVPMVDVSNQGYWENHQTRPLEEVNSGYTAFQADDILFAKITPCTENGKGAYAANPVNGIGFGSTEFHVLRAIPPNMPRFIYHWTRSNLLRKRAAALMIGSAGQQRVPSDFFQSFEVRYLDPEEQMRIVKTLDAHDARIRAEEAVLAKRRQVKRGLMDDLLTGRVRV